MAATPLLLLTGLRCSGKTTLGRAAAEAMSIAFRDLDPLTLSRIGAASVHEAFARVGEPGWRRAEAEALAAAMEDGVGGVLALGGGTPTAPGAATTIRHAQAAGVARVALLDPGPQALLQRLSTGRGDRPALADDDRLEVMRLGAERLPLYRSLADATIDTRLPERDGVRRLCMLLTTGRWPWPSSTASG